MRGGRKDPLMNNIEKPKGVHIFSEHLEFPLMLFSRSEWDKTQIGYIDTSKHTTESLIRWCRNHKIDCMIMYPLKRSSPIRHPIRHLRYLKMMRNLAISL